MFGSGFVTAVAANVARANDAIDRGDSVGAAQAISQAIAVTAAGIAAGLYSASVKMPLEGLSIVFNSLSSNPGLWASALRTMGIDLMDASRVQPIIKTYAYADWTAKGVDYGIDWINDQGIGGKIYDWAHAVSSSIGNTPDPLVKTIKYVDPLILDLDGDGLEITRLNDAASVKFDTDGDGLKTATAWAGVGCKANR